MLLSGLCEHNNLLAVEVSEIIAPHVLAFEDRRIDADFADEAELECEFAKVFTESWKDRIVIFVLEQFDVVDVGSEEVSVNAWMQL